MYFTNRPLHRSLLKKNKKCKKQNNNAWKMYFRYLVKTM